VTGDAIPRIVAGRGLGLALAGAPGPGQAILLGEAVRGGIGRGFRALAGANVTFGLLLVSLALGLSVATPSGVALRFLKVAGGGLLLWLAFDGLRSRYAAERRESRGRALPPTARGALAVLLNPGGWLFLGAVAAPLFATATRVGGTAGAFLVAVALVVGIAIGDGAVVLLGGLGVRRAGERAVLWTHRALGCVLAGLGLWLLVQGLAS